MIFLNPFLAKANLIASKILNLCKRILFLGFSFYSMIACQVTSSDKYASPEKFDTLSIELNKEAKLENPKINILFVVDNSGSMKNYQKKLSDNIEQFAEKFFDNPRIDYRIGVVPIYDSKYLNDKTVYPTYGVRKMNPLGELIPLKGLDNSKDASSPLPSDLFITKHTPNAKKVLKETVLIGTQWGPEAEESFTPVLAVASEAINAQKNNNFYQKDAYLAVIFLTDADDVSLGLSGQDFYQRLVDLKGGDRSKILIAAALPNIQNHSPECSTDGRGPIKSFPELLSASGGLLADLCSENFGSHLAEFGKLLNERVSFQVKQLNFTPDLDTLKVTYGTAEKPDLQVLERVKDYYYNPETNEIIFNPQLKLVTIEGGVLKISAKPVSLENFRSNRLKRL